MQAKKSEKMNVRDYITTAIMMVLIFVVFVAVGAPIGMSVVGCLFTFAACGVLWGTVFLLLYTKVNKKGVVFLVGIIIAALQLLPGYEALYSGVAQLIMGPMLIVGAIATGLVLNSMIQREVAI
jgi:energy-coupling factor transport system substrate-specific component